MGAQEGLRVDEQVYESLLRDKHYIPPDPIRDNSIILDLGCWKGVTTREYAKLCPGPG